MLLTYLAASLKTRMTVIVIMLVLSATALVTIAALYIAERKMNAVIGAQQFALLSSAAAYIDRDLEGKRTLLEAVVEHLPPALLERPEMLQAFIEGHTTLRNEFFNVVVLDRSGKLVANLNDRRQIGKLNFAARPYFGDTLNAREGVISAPFNSALSGKPVVLITIPVSDASGKILYVMGGGIDLQKPRFFGQFGALKPGRTGYLFMITADGVTIDHPDKDRILKKVTQQPGGAVPSTLAALRGVEGWTEGPSERGAQAIMTYKRLSTAGWIVGSVYPVEEAFSPLIDMRGTALLASALVAAVAGVLAWYAIFRLLRPLGALRRHVAKLRAGSQDIGVFQVARGDEFGELSRGFYALSFERQAAMARIVDSEALIRAIIARAPDAFVGVDADGLVTEWNERAEETFGWRRAEVLGRDIGQLIVPPARRGGRAGSLAQLAGGAAGPVPDQRLRVTAVRRDGRALPIELSLGAIQQAGALYSTAFLRDISTQLAFEEKIAAAERQIKLITDHLPVLIFYIDRQHLFQFGNATFEHWFGIVPAAHLGQPLSAAIGEQLYRLARPHLELAFAGQMVSFESVTMIAGQERILETSYVPSVQADGAVDGVYGLTSDMTKIKQIERRLSHLARVDPLTGIGNRRMFEEILKLAIDRTKRGGMMALAYLDIDRFKQINDTHGHGSGDRVLTELAARLVGAVRSTDSVARLAGDEFVIIFEQLKGRDEAAVLGRKIVQAIRRPFQLDGLELAVTSSVGIALSYGSATAPEQLVHLADAALYEAKKAGRDGYRVREMAHPAA
ncbi:MAG: diguanylate cyclase [Pseudomonadota bacterium]